MTHKLTKPRHTVCSDSIEFGAKTIIIWLKLCMHVSVVTLHACVTSERMTVFVALTMSADKMQTDDT